MKPSTLVLAGALALLAGAPAWAHGRGGYGHGGYGYGHAGYGHHHSGASFGIAIGVPLFAPTDPTYWPHAYYDPAWRRPLVVQPPPVVYIERAPALQPLWYYCTSPAGYYPYVQRCELPWRPVAPETVTQKENAP